jgi:hypothetical protein
MSTEQLQELLEKVRAIRDKKKRKSKKKTPESEEQKEEEVTWPREW